MEFQARLETYFMINGSISLRFNLDEETGMYLFLLLISPKPNRKNLPTTSRRVLEIREKLFDLFMLSLSGENYSLVFSIRNFQYFS